MFKVFIVLSHRQTGSCSDGATKNMTILFIYYAVSDCWAKASLFFLHRSRFWTASAQSFKKESKPSRLRGRGLPHLRFEWWGFYKKVIIRVCVYLLTFVR